jgi:pimeloyl-ACP methyl ester carboxylesterase
MHGKASMPSGLGMQNLAAALEAKGYLVSVPEMGWSRNRIYDASYDESMSEIDRIVQELRQKGAKKVIVAGQSQGANAALGYAAHREGADGIIALAPGHVPELGKFRDSVAASVSRAKALIEEGKGRENMNSATSTRASARPSPPRPRYISAGSTRMVRQ